MQYPAWLSNVHAIIQLQSLSCYLMSLSCISEVKTDLLIFADYFPCSPAVVYTVLWAKEVTKKAYSFL